MYYSPVLFNAEGQAFMATILGDQRVGATDRFHFNAFLHLDILGTLAFLLGGFGWPRQIEIDATKFEHPKLYTVITRLSGPLANLLFAGIMASMIHLVMTLMGLSPTYFSGCRRGQRHRGGLQSDSHSAPGARDYLGGIAAGIAWQI